MFRIIETGREVTVGFDNAKECHDYWEHLGVNRDKRCIMHGWPIDQDERQGYDLDYELSDLDYLIPSVNCEAVLKMPKKVFAAIKDKLGELGRYPCTQRWVEDADMEDYLHRIM